MLLPVGWLKLMRRAKTSPPVAPRMCWMSNTWHMYFLSVTNCENNSNNYWICSTAMYTNIFRSDVMHSNVITAVAYRVYNMCFNVTSQFDAYLFNSVAVSLTDVVYAAQQLGHALNGNAEWLDKQQQLRWVNVLTTEMDTPSRKTQSQTWSSTTSFAHHYFGW